MAYTLPSLPYPYNALEPSIDAKTMEIHHTKHHQAYIDKLNKALEGTEWEGKDIVEVLQNLKKLPEDKQKIVRNNGGGHFNHSLFWTVMGPSTSSGGQMGGKPSGKLAQAIDQAFGSFEAFAEKFEAAAVGQFGSGWAWLTVDGGPASAPAGATAGKKLKVESSPNQDSPIMEGKTPILGLDVWEHAYYLNYQNKRPDYAKAFWRVVNWDEVERRFAQATSA